MEAYGYTYSSYCDVTALVRQYSEKVDNGIDPPNCPGYAIYSVGGNFANQGADIQKNAAALQTLDFAVCHELFMTGHPWK